MAGDRGDADRALDARQRPRPPHRARCSSAPSARSSLGISYALLMTDVTLASGVPSITARSRRHAAARRAPHRGAVRLASGPDGGRIGAFLVAALYQGSAVACAMFFTGQASNMLGANLAGKLVNVAGDLGQLARGRHRSGPRVVRRRAVGRAPRAAARRCVRTPEAPALRGCRSSTRWARSSRDEWITLAVFARRRPALDDHRAGIGSTSPSSPCSGSACC